jgi:hypothetical protein
MVTNGLFDVAASLSKVSVATPHVSRRLCGPSVSRFSWSREMPSVIGSTHAYTSGPDDAAHYTVGIDIDCAESSAHEELASQVVRGPRGNVVHAGRHCAQFFMCRFVVQGKGSTNRSIVVQWQHRNETWNSIAR